MFPSAVNVTSEGDIAEHTLADRASGRTSILSAYPHINAETPYTTKWKCDVRDDEALAVLYYIDCAKISQAMA